MSTNIPLTERPEGRALFSHLDAMRTAHMRDLFSADPDRFTRFHLTLDGLVFDYSKNRISQDTIDHLVALAKACDLETKRDALFAGERMNTTENRAVLHTALRGECPDDLVVDGENIAAFVASLKEQIKAISTDIRGNDVITDVIHIGVGGSDLGPRLVCEALASERDGPRVHFLSNIDGQSVNHLLDALKPRHTVALIASKTFTTLETMSNAQHVKDWLAGDLGADQVSQHLYAMSSAVDNAEAFGVPRDHILPMRDWIGGRFSVWSSIGLPIAIAVGFDVFSDFLRGAATVDTHFKTEPLARNIPALMGLLGAWYRNFWDFHAHAVLPYADSLSLLPTYMQQMDMESNGKHAACATSPVVFGAPGTGAQHAFMQSLHQGTDIVPCDFIIAARNPDSPDSFQQALVANALAQSQALMRGRPNEAEPHRHFEGNRPSNSFVIPELSPYYLGMLMALYEHKIFVQGTLWGINSFDQWGVELGKVLAKDIIHDLKNNSISDEHDASTAGLIRGIVAA